MIQAYDILRAAQQARIAIRRGDLDAAERWFRIAERAGAIVQRLTAIEANVARKTWPRNPA